MAIVSPGGVPPNVCSQRWRNSCAGRNRPFASRLPVNGWLRAPGMWPATGSSVSFWPANRSAPRASTSAARSLARIPSATIRSSSAAVTNAPASGAATNLRARGHGLIRGQRQTGPLPRGKSAIEHGDLLVARPAQQPPKARGIGTVCLIVGDDLSAPPEAAWPIPQRPSVAASCSSDGRGWRPVCGPAGPDRSRSRWA